VKFVCVQIGGNGDIARAAAQYWVATIKKARVPTIVLLPQYQGVGVWLKSLLPNLRLDIFAGV
jgi:hypothetical protein